MERARPTPTLVILTGPNGAGKSTMYALRVRRFFPDLPFINADLIQRDELNAGGDPSRSYEAAQIADARRKEHLAKGKSFVAESVFSHESKLLQLREAQQAGFELVVFHVGVESADTSIERVKLRVAEGGHAVPDDKVRDRFERNKALIKQAVLLADYAQVFDNSIHNVPPREVLRLRAGKCISNSDEVPIWVREMYGELMVSKPRPRGALKRVH